MKWISKSAPIYVFWGDEWERETDRKIFKPCKAQWAWEGENEWIPFTKKTRILKASR